MEGFPAGAEEHEALAANSRVAVLDFGGQYVDLVVKAVHRLGYEADLLLPDTNAERLSRHYGAVIMSGSPASSHLEEAPRPDPALWEQDIPTLGICYGMQAMALAFGGEVRTSLLREDGRAVTKVDTAHPLFGGVKAETSALFTHGDFVTSLPPEVSVLGSHALADGTTVTSAIEYRNFLGVQFHPEVFEDTPEGYQIIKNFLEGVAGIAPDRELRDDFIAKQVAAKRAEIADQAKGRPVIAFVSGGVDSAVAAALAADEDLRCYYIDNGFMRDEDDDVITMLKEAGIAVKTVQAADYFANATVEIDGKVSGPLKSVSDPQVKRRIIGKAFIDVRDQILRELDLDEALLLQGTNAADRIESGHSKGGGQTAVIKTHHNQVDEVKKLEAAGLLIEPLSDLYKDEIRLLGHHLGLPEDLVERQPFPGPGLAIRIIASERAGAVARPPAEADIRQYVAERSDYHARLLPVRSVGVGGDARSHLSALALSGAPDWPKLHALATELPGNFKQQLNRVVYALGPAPLDEASSVPTGLDGEVTSQLRRADAIVFDEMRRAGLLRHVSQFPVVLLPLAFGGKGGSLAVRRSIVLRPISSVTFMVSQAMLPGLHLPTGFIEGTAERILGTMPDISQVFLDLTNKPPATTEWE